MARLLGIAYKPKRRAAVITCERAQITEEAGLLPDHRGKPGKRQITVMSLTAWQAACDELGVALPWYERRANLLVDELPLYQSTGRQIRIGEVLLEITGETDPCARMDEVQPGLFAALQPHWRGGVNCRVLHGGIITTDTAVELLASSTQKAVHE